MVTEVRIRAFRADEEPETCLRFIEGHRKILDNHGINKVTSSNNEWIANPAVFVVAVESMDGSRMFGGARIHAVDGIHPLPIEGAVGELDDSVFQWVRKLAVSGTGEICGLWNSKEVAGLGIGAVFSTRAAVTIGTQIGLSSVISLSSPVTVKFSEFQGGGVVTALGNNGWSTNLNQPMASLPVVIYNFANSPYDDEHALAWAGALLVTATVLVLSVIARVLENQKRT